MFLAGAPFFQQRFASNKWVVTHFQSSILSVSCITNLSSVLVLAKLQQNASYPRRITSSLILNIFVFSLLAISTILFRGLSVGVYFVFLLTLVFAASLATGLNQNGLFAYVTGFARAEYIQAIMAGQAVAGVLPPIVEIISVLAVPEDNETADDDVLRNNSSKSAFAYFITATAVSGVALVAFTHLRRRQKSLQNTLNNPEHRSSEGAELTTTKKFIPLWSLFKKLRWMALGVYLCFAVTMVFPVFTAEIESVRDKNTMSRLFEPSIFIPLAFLFWNAGDLFGRVILLIPKFNLSHYPFALFVMSLARLVFIPLYLQCNVRGRGSWINSDAFYLVIVQFLFGATNGYVGASCMVGAAEWVAVEEREAAGGFMGLMLVGGLTTGSLLSFLVSSF